MAEKATSPIALDEVRQLGSVLRQVAAAHRSDEIIAAIRDGARRLTGADGIAFIVREDDQVFHADESAIAPLWKGRRFPIHGCLAGRALLERAPVIVGDVYEDGRVDAHMFQSTFVRSLVIVPVGRELPVAAIGAYWARPRGAAEHDLEVLQWLADTAAIAFRKVAAHLRDQLIGFVSHDLKNPLATVLAALQIVLRKARLHPDDARVIGRAVSSAQRMDRIIHQLLDYTRLRIDGTVPLDRTRVSLNAVCRRVADELEVAHTRVTLTLHERDTVVGQFDEGRLAEILSNVIGNACQYSFPDCQVEVTIRRDGKFAQIDVLNQADPIPDELLPHIFEPFRGHASGTRSTGLGLFITQQLVRAHGGAITVTSSRAAGTRFTIRLPIE